MSMGTNKKIQKICALIIVYATLPVCHADDEIMPRLYIENELMIIQDFNEVRQNVIDNKSIDYENIISSEKPAAEVSKSVKIEVPADEEFPKSLEERRKAAHNNWKFMTKEEKDDFFSTLPKAAEERLKNRQEYLRSRLGLLPVRGKNTTDDI
ncbi:MAG: hypothetical protein ACI8QY_000953 [bacterium]|jgi:hypothetical protein